MVQPEESPSVISVSVTAKGHIYWWGDHCFQRRDVCQAAVEEDAVGSQVEQQADPFLGVANTVRQAGQAFSPIRNPRVATLHLEERRAIALVSRTVTIIVIRVVETIFGAKKQSRDDE